MAWKFGRSKPVIGLVGGIGAGKSAVARLLGREGCAVIDSDALSHEALQSEHVKKELRPWLGEGVFETDGTVSRQKVGRRVFGDQNLLVRLNAIIHPAVAQRRAEWMVRYMADPAVRAVVWDTPLLVEAGLDRECDAIIFVKAPKDMRLERVRKSRGWGEEEMARREKLQIPLDKKAEVADYCIDNRGDELTTLHQIQQVLSHLFATSRS